MLPMSNAVTKTRITPADRRLYRLMAQVLGAAGHEVRLAILDYLRDGEQCVCDIAAHVGAGRPNVSRHLAVLRGAGLVEQRKDGLRMMYSLRCPCILNITTCVTGVLRERARQTRKLLGSVGL